MWCSLLGLMSCPDSEKRTAGDEELGSPGTFARDEAGFSVLYTEEGGGPATATGRDVGIARKCCRGGEIGERGYAQRPVGGGG